VIARLVDVRANGKDRTFGQISDMQDVSAGVRFEADAADLNTLRDGNVGGIRRSEGSCVRRSNRLGGIQLTAVFQSPDCGVLLHVAEPAGLGWMLNKRSKPGRADDQDAERPFVRRQMAVFVIRLDRF